MAKVVKKISKKTAKKKPKFGIQIELSGFEKDLTEFLAQSCKKSKLSLSDLKDIIWNEQSAGLMSRVIFTIAEQNPKTDIDEIMQMIQRAWNTFPHSSLNGLSPLEMAERFDNDPEFNPEEREDFFSIFEDQFPSEVRIEKMGEAEVGFAGAVEGATDWQWEFPANMQSGHAKLSEMREKEEELAEKFDFGESSAAGMEMMQEMSLMFAQTLLAESPFYFEAAELLAHDSFNQDETDQALSILNNSIVEARKIFPKEFRLGIDRLPWGFLDNRPFLHLLGEHATLVDSEHGPTKAIRLYEELIALNPNDNQGIRAYLSTAYLKTGKFQEIAELYKKYPDDMMAELVIGAILAEYKQGKLHEATLSIKKAKKRFGHVFKEILKTNHSQPELTPGRMRVGGDDEAWYYWQAQGTLWMAASGAREFLKATLEA